MYLVNENGNTDAEYEYDPYGKILSATGEIAEINPLRYRSYYYDSETGFYYLQSRYYDPNTCRFINADSYASTGQGFLGYNMFAYCGNNPIDRVDSGGNFGILATIGIGIATQYISDVVGNVIDGKTGWDVLKPTSSVGEYIASGVTALIPGGSGVKGVLKAVADGLVTELIVGTEKFVKGEEINFADSAMNFATGVALDGFIDIIGKRAKKLIQDSSYKTYSSYANDVHQTNPSASYEQIYAGYTCINQINVNVTKGVIFGLDVGKQYINSRIDMYK